MNDIHTAWTETQTVLGKSQAFVVDALEQIRKSHVEQKNWTHLRRLKGYLRYPKAVAALNELYRGELCSFQNLNMPSVKLPSKTSVGSRLRRHYD